MKMYMFNHKFHKTLVLFLYLLLCIIYHTYKNDLRAIGTTIIGNKIYMNKKSMRVKISLMEIFKYFHHIPHIFVSAACIMLSGQNLIVKI